FTCAIADSTQAGIVGVDLDGRIRYVNQSAAQFLGYAPEELVGSGIDLLIPPEERSPAAEIRRRAAAGERVVPQHVRRVRKDQTVVEQAVVVSRIRGSSGDVMGVSEVTHQIATASSHEEAASRLASIVTWSDDVIVSKDLNGIVTSWNRAAERMFG